ncbi:hypothetical protein ACIG56_00285 [Nocardia fusca]|uniref:hypothetical protein n=1 Tax=Nocardia fusca TaxID=941183 RepID=UPI0037CAC15C
MRAAEEAPVCLHAVADDPALTVLADRCQPVNGAFEAIEYMPGTLRLDRECHRVLVAANLTLGHSAMICPSYHSANDNDVPLAILVGIVRTGERYHDIEICTSGVWRIRCRLDFRRLPA